jgi:hypothetical protein
VTGNALRIEAKDSLEAGQMGFMKTTAGALGMAGLAFTLAVQSAAAQDQKDSPREPDAVNRRSGLRLLPLLP